MPMVLLAANSSNAETRAKAIELWVKLYASYGRKVA